MKIKGSIGVFLLLLRLSTNIPLNETIDIACNYVYQQYSPPKNSKENFKRFLHIAAGGNFLHRGRLCYQINGVTMGSPLNQH